jgi:hypothetical protein
VENLPVRFVDISIPSPTEARVQTICLQLQLRRHRLHLPLPPMTTRMSRRATAEEPRFSPRKRRRN